LTLHLTTNEFYNIYQSRIDQNEAKRFILVEFNRIGSDPVYFLSDLCIGTKKCIQVPGQAMGIAFYTGLAGFCSIFITDVRDIDLQPDTTNRIIRGSRYLLHHNQ
jgi:hypothetical protein